MKRGREHGSFKHGAIGTPEYDIWRSMNQRCANPNVRNYDNYGGRGIRVCDRWRHDFTAFLADVGYRPSKHHSLDRYPDKNGNYEPGNVRWALPDEQAKNRRTAKDKIRRAPKKDYARLLKCACLLCGYTVRVSKRWLAAGAPICQTDDTQMRCDE